MKEFTVILKSGYKTTLEAKDKNDLLRKIESGHYGILPIRGEIAERITIKNIEKIVEKI